MLSGLLWVGKGDLKADKAKVLEILKMIQFHSERKGTSEPSIANEVQEKTHTKH